MKWNINLSMCGNFQIHNLNTFFKFEFALKNPTPVFNYYDLLFIDLLKSSSLDEISRGSVFIGNSCEPQSGSISSQLVLLRKEMLFIIRPFDDYLISIPANYKILEF